MPVLLPAHPRTRKMIERGPDDPADHDHSSRWATSSSCRWRPTPRAVLTDSGGVQEETTYLGVPCFTLRDNTERPITIEAGTNALLGLDPDRIADDPARLLAATVEPPPQAPPLVGRARGRAPGRRDLREAGATSGRPRADAA